MATHPSNPIQQACAIPYRNRLGRPEFCLITSRKGYWGFPKGIVDPGETPVQTALKEALEEAGVHGVIEGETLGQFQYFKWGCDLVVATYLMRVTRADDDWEEADWRERCWCRADEAREKIFRDELCDLLEIALRRIAPDDQPG